MSKMPKAKPVHKGKVHSNPAAYVKRGKSFKTSSHTTSSMPAVSASKGHGGGAGNSTNANKA